MTQCLGWTEDETSNGDSLPISLYENVAMKMLLLLPEEQVENQDAMDSNSSVTLTAHTKNKDCAIWPEENKDSAYDNNNNNEIDNHNNSLTSSSSSNTLRYKTEMCKNFAANNYCAYGDNCQFAHGQEVSRFSKFIDLFSSFSFS